jgi:TolB protein
MYVGSDCNESVLVSLPHVGSKVLFVSNVGSKDPDDFTLFSVNSDGSGGLAKISKVSYGNPILMSSDEKTVSFTGLVNGTNQVFVADVDGKNVLQLTFDNKPKSAIAIFPDGKKIIYAAHPFNDIGAVNNFFTINNDGTNQVQLTNDSSEKAWPVVSADGTTLVFNDITNETSKILAVNTDGSNLHYVTEGSLFSHLPVLVSANGSKIVFSMDNPNDSNTKHLYTIDLLRN